MGETGLHLFCLIKNKAPMLNIFRKISQKLRRATEIRSPLQYAYIGDGIGLAHTHRGQKIIVYTRDFGISPHIILNGIWETHVEKAIISLLKPGQTIVEVGSNMGYHTLASCHAIGPTGRLYGFEANPALYELLKWTLDLNTYSPFTTIYNHAVSDREGELNFQFTPRAVGGGNVFYGASDQSEVIKVKGEPLDITLSDVASIDMLRMDAEGSEPLIIKGAEKLIARSPNLKIICEWSLGMMSSRVNIPDFTQYLSNMGFRAWKILGDGSLQAISMSDLNTMPHSDVCLCRDEPV